MIAIMSCTSLDEFRAWLASNHSQSDGIWLRIYKKDSGAVTVTYARDHRDVGAGREVSLILAVNEQPSPLGRGCPAPALSPAGAGRVRGQLRGAVIPAKTGIHCANLRKCTFSGMDSRFRGNDRLLNGHLQYHFWLAGLSPSVGQAKSLNSPV